MPGKRGLQGGVTVGSAPNQGAKKGKITPSFGKEDIKSEKKKLENYHRGKGRLTGRIFVEHDWEGDARQGGVLVFSMEKGKYNRKKR